MKRYILTLVAVLGAAGAHAEDTSFFQASLVPSIAIHSSDTRIEGIALSIWGENPQSAFAWGFLNGSTGDSSGLSLGLANYADSYTGVHLGTVNWAKGTFVGVQSGLVNIAKEVRGVQFGTVNYCESMHGLQIGLVNIINDNPWFKDFPDKLAKGFVFVNWSF
jgi:hypothetical protein